MLAISLVAAADCSANAPTCSATMVKPCPYSPARPASTLALMANTLVFRAISSIKETAWEIFCEDSPRRFIFLAVSPTVVLSSRILSTVKSISWVLFKTV